MPPLISNRLKALEAKLGAPIPTNLVTHLGQRKPISEGGFGFRAKDRMWDIRTTFRLDKSSEEQLDKVYGLVGDVLPPGALPFAEDWGGNFYCLMVSGRSQGQVVYWDHERDPGDHHTKRLAATLEDFYAGVEPMAAEDE